MKYLYNIIKKKKWLKATHFFDKKVLINKKNYDIISHVFGNTTQKYVSLAQLVEQLTLNQWV